MDSAIQWAQMSQIYILLSIHVYPLMCARWWEGGGGGGGRDARREGGRQGEREGWRTEATAQHLGAHMSSEAG